MIKNASEVLLLVLTCTFLLTGVPRASEATVLGLCGSSSTQRYLIPDGACIFPNGDVRPFAGNMPQGKYVSFSAACGEHDRCYASRGANKGACDSHFYRSLTDACRNALTNTFPESGRKACYQLAIKYNDTVRARGCEPFKKAQQNEGVRSPACD